jgi:hypothetical protein
MNHLILTEVVTEEEKYAINNMNTYTPKKYMIRSMHKEKRETTNFIKNM